MTNRRKTKMSREIYLNAVAGTERQDHREITAGNIARNVDRMQQHFGKKKQVRMKFRQGVYIATLGLIGRPLLT